MSDKGIEWLKQKEGSVQKDGKHVVYDDKNKHIVPDGAPLPKGATIGYGHLVKPGENFDGGITDAQATELLKQDIATAEKAVRDNITVPLRQNQYDALVSLAYNIGTGNFKESTVVKYINNPDFHSTKYSTMESAWKIWNKQGGRVVNGLINRREYEWNMFKNADYNGDR